MSAASPAVQAGALAAAHALHVTPAPILRDAQPMISRSRRCDRRGLRRALASPDFRTGDHPMKTMAVFALLLAVLGDGEEKAGMPPESAGGGDVRASSQ